MRSQKRTFVVKSVGGQLCLPYEELEAFCKSHPNKVIFLRAEVAPNEVSERTKSFYWNYIIPEMQEVLREKYGEVMKPTQADKWLREQCAICYEGERLQSVDTMGSARMNAFIEWLQVYAAENFNLILEDAK